MPDRVNPCLRKDGTPKAGFASKGAAERWIERNITGFDVQGVVAYPCKTHGWHVGAMLRRAPHRRGLKGKW